MAILKGWFIFVPLVAFLAYLLHRIPRHITHGASYVDGRVVCPGCGGRVVTEARWARDLICWLRITMGVSSSVLIGSMMYTQLTHGEVIVDWHCVALTTLVGTFCAALLGSPILMRHWDRVKAEGGYERLRRWRCDSCGEAF